MVHISELSWSRIKNPAEVVSIGDHLDVYVISFDPEKRKISLGVKDRTQNPWDVFMNTYKVGDVANVRIAVCKVFLTCQRKKERKKETGRSLSLFSSGKLLLDRTTAGAPTIPTRSTRLWPHARMSSRTSRSAAA